MELKSVWKVKIRIKDKGDDGSFEPNPHYVMAASIELAVRLVSDFYAERERWRLVQITEIVLESRCGIT